MSPGGQTERETPQAFDVNISSGQVRSAVNAAFTYAQQHGFEILETLLSDQNLSREQRANMIDYLYSVMQYSMTQEDASLFPPERTIRHMPERDDYTRKVREATDLARSEGRQVTPEELAEAQTADEANYQRELATYEEGLAAYDSFDISQISEASRDAFGDWVVAMKRELQQGLGSGMETVITRNLEARQGEVPFGLEDYSQEQRAFASLVFHAYNMNRAMEPPPEYAQNEPYMGAKRIYTRDDSRSDRNIPIIIELTGTEATAMWAPWIYGQGRGTASF